MGEAPRLCVFCRIHPIDPTWRPFCSERCKLQDLARWADGTYRVAAEPVEEREHSEDEDEE
jgi:endogenous inhibitor of DNA gyrase (YacG/DUF329 family)